MNSTKIDMKEVILSKINELSEKIKISLPTYQDGNYDYRPFSAGIKLNQMAQQSNYVLFLMGKLCSLIIWAKKFNSKVDKTVV